MKSLNLILALSLVTALNAQADGLPQKPVVSACAPYARTAQQGGLPQVKKAVESIDNWHTSFSNHIIAKTAFGVSCRNVGEHPNNGQLANYDQRARDLMRAGGQFEDRTTAALEWITAVVEGRALDDSECEKQLRAAFQVIKTSSQQEINTIRQVYGRGADQTCGIAKSW